MLLNDHEDVLQASGIVDLRHFDDHLEAIIWQRLHN